MTSKIPDRIKVGPFDYRIVVGGRQWDQARLTENDATLVGHHSPSDLTIAIQPSLATGLLREVLLHELMHACFNAVGQPLNDEAEEDAVRSLAPQLLAVLRDNPAVVAFLTADQS